MKENKYERKKGGRKEKREEGRKAFSLFLFSAFIYKGNLPTILPWKQKFWYFLEPSVVLVR